MTRHLTFDVLSRMAERSLPPLDEAKASRHLARCGRCRSELAWLQRIRARPPYGLQPAPDADIFGVNPPRPADGGERDQPDDDAEGGASHINRDWLMGNNNRSSLGWQRTAG
jgi:hypothetical protein